MQIHSCASVILSTWALFYLFSPLCILSVTFLNSFLINYTFNETTYRKWVTLSHENRFQSEIIIAVTSMSIYLLLPIHMSSVVPFQNEWRRH